MSYFDFYTEELTAEQRQELNGLMAIHEKAGARPYDAAMQAVRDKLAQAHENKAEVEKAIFEGANPLKKYVDGAAHKSASSPKNSLPIPTAAQREAGNHTMGHLTLHGLSITIEIPKGGERSGIAPDGTPWSVEMLSHYGYLKRAIGADGENFDCYIGDDPSSQRVWIVDQVNAETGLFDEHKALIGYEDQEDATRAYLGAFSDGKGKARIGAITEISLESFKAWLKTDKTQKPMSAVLSDENNYPSKDSNILESAYDYKSEIEKATSFDDIQAVFTQLFPANEPWQTTRPAKGDDPDAVAEIFFNSIIGKTFLEDGIERKIVSVENENSGKINTTGRILYIKDVSSKSTFQTERAKGTYHAIYRFHKGLIAQAQAEGKPVPVEVLKDYPELDK